MWTQFKKCVDRAIFHERLPSQAQEFIVSTIAKFDQKCPNLLNTV